MSDNARPFAATGDGVRVALKVTPKAARDRIGGVAADADGHAVLKVAVTAAPERGKANDAVIRLLAKAWGVPKTRITVTAGATGRRKTLVVAGDPDELAARLESWIEEHCG